MYLPLSFSLLPFSTSPLSFYLLSPISSPSVSSLSLSFPCAIHLTFSLSRCPPLFSISPYLYLSTVNRSPVCPCPLSLSQFPSLSFSTSRSPSLSLCPSSAVSHSHWHSTLSRCNLSIHSICLSFSRPVSLSPRISGLFCVLPHSSFPALYLKLLPFYPAFHPSIQLLSPLCFLSTLHITLDLFHPISLSLLIHLPSLFFSLLFPCLLSNLYISFALFICLCSHTTLPSFIFSISQLLYIYNLSLSFSYLTIFPHLNLFSSLHLFLSLSLSLTLRPIPYKTFRLIHRRSLVRSHSLLSRFLPFVTITNSSITISIPSLSSNLFFSL